MSCFTTFAKADDIIENEENDDKEIVELNAFGFPDKSFVTLIENNANSDPIPVTSKPECSNKTLIQKARAAAEPHINLPANSIFNKRRNLLITKNIDNFIDLSIEDALEMDNRVVKARIVELKINNKIQNQNIKICQSENPILKNKLFILLYDDKQGNVIGEVLNLATKNIPSFYFYDK